MECKTELQWKYFPFSASGSKSEWKKMSTPLMAHDSTSVMIDKTNFLTTSDQPNCPVSKTRAMTIKKNGLQKRLLVINTFFCSCYETIFYGKFRLMQNYMIIYSQRMDSTCIILLQLIKCIVDESVPLKCIFTKYSQIIKLSNTWMGEK